MLNELTYRILSIVRKSPQTFGNILDESWGVSPPDLYSELERLKSQGAISQSGNLYRCEESRYASTNAHNTLSIDRRKRSRVEGRVESFLSKLPIPHPHDFDWRFSVNGIRAFVEHILKYHNEEHSICVISAPTVYAYLRILNVLPFLSLFERSQDTVDIIHKYFGDSYGVIRHDLQYPWPNRGLGGFDCIIMDPPWYQDYYELFLLRASEILSPGGLIHTAIFPPFTKTYALAERSAIFSFALNRGLHLIDLESGILEYESPPFERKAFAVHGLESKNNWRRGDLASFFMGFKYGRDHVFAVESGRWREFRVGRSKLKIRIEEIPSYERPEIENVEEQSPYLSSISRKHEPRQKIGLWTSCQQAFQVKGNNVVSLLLECVLKGSMGKEESFERVASEFDVPLDTVRQECATCYDKIKEIIKREEEVQNDL